MGITADLRVLKRRDRLNAYARSCKLVDARDGKCCRLCTAWVESGAHHHHIIPRSLGGPNTTGNLIRICFQCHGLVGKKFRVTGDADGELDIEPIVARRHA